jgi:hypothetical protein
LQGKLPIFRRWSKRLCWFDGRLCGRFFQKHRDRRRKRKEYVIAAADCSRFEPQLRTKKQLIGRKLAVWRWRTFFAETENLQVIGS